jgi:hypothetical protein
LFDIPAALRAQYGYGDAVQKDQLWSILAGETSLAAIYGAEYDARTISGSGSRLVLLGNYREGMSIEEQLRLGVTLGHEAYRDGYDWLNTAETQDAVWGHSEMAVRMILGGEQVAYDTNLAQDLTAYFNAKGNQALFNEYVNASYDSSADYWLLKKDGTLVDDGSADLHWEAVEKGKAANGNPIYKTIMSFPGMSKEESLVAMLGGNANARAVLEANNITITDNLSAAELGALIASTMNTGAGGSLTIAYSQFKDNLNKDWQGIYQSYTANEAFYKAYTNRGVYRGDQGILQAKNMGEAITSDLEYYAVLHPYLLAEIGKIGGTGVTDPLAYLAANTSKFAYEGWGSVTVHNQMHDRLRQAFDETIANGGSLPPRTNDGLWLRFQDASYNGNLYLSMHTVGMAIDFDSANNDFYPFNNYELTDRTYNGYIERTVGAPLTQVQGWTDNQTLAAASRGYREYVNSEIDRLSAALSQQSGHALSSRLDALEVQLNALKQVQADLNKNAELIQQLSFTLNQTFTDTMRKYFSWGGDWPRSKDYMHFEVRR